jgi:hypothetical protein
MRHWMFAAALAVAAMLGATATARAGLIPVQVSVTPEGGNFQFTYAIVLPSDAVLQRGDYFTIYNFEGLVPGTATASGSMSSSNWNFTTTNLGPTPAGVVPADNPNIPNLTWTYTGSVMQGGQTGLGNFSAVSIYPYTTQSWFAALTGTVYGLTDSNVTPTQVPVPTAPPPGLPEPTTLALAALGLLFVGVVRWRQRTLAVA